MQSEKLYSLLEEDFELKKCKDKWSQMNFNEFISPNFKNRYMGLVLDNTNIVNKVYTAVFPSEKVIKEILIKEEKNVLLFTHHPMVWDIRKTKTYNDIEVKYLKLFKKNSISLYTLHMPLDRVSEYSVNTNLCKALGLKKIGEFFKYHDLMVGIIGKTSITKIKDFVKHCSDVLRHEVKLYSYGEERIRKGKVAIIGGSGNLTSVYKELEKLHINTYLTGVTALTKRSENPHYFAKQKRINVIGCTHYSSEKFACIKMCDYFKKIGLKSEFIEDNPILDDL